jgi:hypothetical protein
MTNVIVRQSVTLTPEECGQVMDLLRTLASARSADAQRTKSAAVRAYCQTQARTCWDLEAELLRRTYTAPAGPETCCGALVVDEVSQ